jgi:hypothetical protein
MDVVTQRIANLSPGRRALLMSRLRQLNHERSRTLQISRRTDADQAPLSFAQQRLWFLDLYEPNNSFYNFSSAFRLRGPLNIDALERSLNEITRRHEVLRTVVLTRDGQPVQVVEPHQYQNLVPIDVQTADEATRLVAEEARRPFDLEIGPLARTTLIRPGAEDHVLLLTMHHIITDSWSIGILFRELSILYPGFINGTHASLPELNIQYADFADWQRRWLIGDVLEKQLDYWREQLRGVPPLLNLPTDRPRPAIATTRGAHESCTLPKTLSQAIRDLSRQENATLFMTLLAGFQILLQRYTGQDDLCVGTPIAGRRWRETQTLIGFFVNTLAIRGNMCGNPRFREFLKSLRHTVLEAFSHQDVSFEQVVDLLQPVRDPSYAPLVQAMFVMQNRAAESLSLPGISLSPILPYSGQAKFDLALGVKDNAEGMTAILEYNADLFDAVTINRMLNHFQTLLESIVADPNQRLSELTLISDEEMRLLEEWGAA